jgi:hypothetical protein
MTTVGHPPRSPRGYAANHERSDGSTKPIAFPNLPDRAWIAAVRTIYLWADSRLRRLAQAEEKELMARKPRAPAMSKEAMREESERLVREAMARNVIITQGKTRLDVKCSKCGAPNHVSAEVNHSRVEYACKECCHIQKTL